MKNNLPEKARLLEILKQTGFQVPDFMYLSAGDFEKENFTTLGSFLKKSCGSYKIIVRSAHPLESFYKGGTFDSLETNADITGVKYARARILKLARTAKRLNILRQQRFNNAPELDLDQMGVVVMPFIEGAQVMAKQIGNHWEFGYTGDDNEHIQSESYITITPHDPRLLQMSDDIQKKLGMRSEIEYIVSPQGEIYVVQAKDISTVEMLEPNKVKQSISLDGIRRLRQRSNYRERVIYVMDNPALYRRIIERSEEWLKNGDEGKNTFEDVLRLISDYEAELESFALKFERFGVLGLKIRVPEDLFQKTNHCLDAKPKQQQILSDALYQNQYKIDYFLSEADTVIAKDRLRLNMCTHTAYGVDTVRNPLWFIHWTPDHHDEIVGKFKKLGFKTRDLVGIEINPGEKPLIYRL